MQIALTQFERIDSLISSAEFAATLGLVDLAERIITDGPASALHCSFSTRETREWQNAARWYLCAISDGLDDEDDFAGMVDEFFNAPRDQGWSLDQDFLRDERAAWSAAA